MKLSRAFLNFFIALFTVGAGAQNAPQPLLPENFAGWQKQQPTKISTEPRMADETNVALLRELGFIETEQATYTRPGRQIKMRAVRFETASGAYGAFTTYKDPVMITERFGDQGAAANERFIFFKANVLVTGTLDRVTAMTASELRALADAVPQASKQAATPPVLPTYLPKQSLVANSERYALGPVAYARAGSPLPSEILDFGRGAEVVAGKYATSNGTGTLTIIEYPTPQLAADRLKAVQEWLRSKQGSVPAKSVQARVFNNPEEFTKRSGFFVVVASDEIGASEAKSLLAAVNYDASVTWNEATGLERKTNLGSLLIGVFTLIGILILGMIIAGFMFGGVRVMMKKLFPDRVFDRPQDVEIIRLNLEK